MSSFKETFNSCYNWFFATKPIDGEVCHRDILKCFEYSGWSKKYARAKEDILVHKATRVNDSNLLFDRTHSITSLIIPKGTRVHLGLNYHRHGTPYDFNDLDYMKCRAEEARVVQADVEGKRTTTYSIYSEERSIAYTNGQVVKPSEFFDQEFYAKCYESEQTDQACDREYDVTCKGGIHFFLRKSYAERYGKL